MTFLRPTEFKKFLLYARQMEIRGVDLDAPYYNYIISFTVPDIDNVTVLDYDAREQRVYWSDVRTQAIKRAFINGTGVETVVSAGSGPALHPKAHTSHIPCGPDTPSPNLISSLLLDPHSPGSTLSSAYTLQIPTTDSLFVPPDLPNAHGLAVDWVSRNLFWTSYDTNKKQINVARLDGSFKNAVVQGLEQPHGLVVHPLRGSVCSPGLGSTCVRRGGEDPYPILGSFPSKLYWTDGDNISMANMDGSNHTLLFSGQKGPVGMHLPFLLLQASSSIRRCS
jgi:hypothetical protein